MAKKEKKEYTCSCFISIDDKEPVPVKSLTDEQRESCLEKMSERLSKAMSLYYTQHPEEYEAL